MRARSWTSRVGWLAVTALLVAGAARVWLSMRAREARDTAVASITATPNPVPIENRSQTGAATIAWTTADNSPAQVFVSVDGGPATLFDGRASGSGRAEWIALGHQYEFRLHRGAPDGSPLARATVTAKRARTPVWAITGWGFALLGALLLLVAAVWISSHSGAVRLSHNLGAVAVIVGLVLVFFYRVLLLDTASIPFDLQGWHYPRLAFMGDALRRGEFPLWNPHLYGGMPFAVNHAFHPMRVALAGAAALLFGVVPYGAVEFLMALQYAIAGVGAWRLARSFDLSQPASVAAAVVYMIGPYLASQTQHLGLMMAAPWVPVVLLAARRTIERPGLGWATRLAVAFSMVIVAAIPTGVAPLAVALLFVAVPAIVRRARNQVADGARVLGRFAWAAALSLGLSAVALLPFIQLSRASIATERGLSHVLGPNTFAFATTLVPNFFNVASEHGYWADVDLTQQYFFLPTMVLALAGAALVGRRRRLGRALVAGSVALLLLSTTFAARLFPLFELLPNLFIGAFELANVRLYADLGIGLAAGLGLDALMASTTETRAARPHWIAAWAMLAILATTLVLIAVYPEKAAAATASVAAAEVGPAQLAAIAASAREALAWAASAGAGLAAIAWLGRLRNGSGYARASCLALVLIAAPMLRFGSHQRFNTADIRPADALGPHGPGDQPTHVVEFLQAQRDRGEPFRIENTGASLDSWTSATTLWHLDNINGADPLLPSDTQQFRAAFSRAPMFGGRTFVDVDLDSPLLDLFNVRYIVGAKADRLPDAVARLQSNGNDARYALAFSDPVYDVIENRAVLPRALVVPRAEVVADRGRMLQRLASGDVNPRQILLVEHPLPGGGIDDDGHTSLGTPSATPRYTAIGPNHVQIDVADSAGGVLLVLDPFWPGWSATVDGVPTAIARADYLFRAVVLPAGPHRVEMTYRPWWVPAGLAVTLASALIAGVVLSRRNAYQNC